MLNLILGPAMIKFTLVKIVGKHTPCMKVISVFAQNVVAQAINS